MRNHQKVNALIAQAKRKKRCCVSTNAVESRALYRRSVAGELVKPYPGLFFPAEDWKQLDYRHRTLYVARALHFKHPDWGFAAFTAAVIYGFDLRQNLYDGTIYVADSSSSSNSRLLRRVSMPHAEVCYVDGIPVTSVARTLVDCGLRCAFRDALPLYDSALRAGLVFLDDVAAERQTLRHGRALIDRLICCADAKSESGGESFCRATMIEEGFPIPQLQVEYANDAGSTYRVDFQYRLRGGEVIVVEFDGMEKYVNPLMTHGAAIEEVVRREQERERFLFRSGVSRIVRLTYRDVVGRSELVHKLADAGVPCMKLAG
ncbi:hypothetical protein OZX62_01225 [Bifidobacterium sp. ESL0690]|uniref:hypothetical protein n=1 Tax=Bifidobacterium sp. ESL0690 TaxID=2983214 RepID=UPI0023F7173B|nr:hypothetical protein [Bifidobacterium sp. ESL0690]WEV46950.1 hypothetical protein OZX62_01225 [Bifidobacterium sp. ESL0690]